MELLVALVVAAFAGSIVIPAQARSLALAHSDTSGHVGAVAPLLLRLSRPIRVGCSVGLTAFASGVMAFRLHGSATISDTLATLAFGAFFVGLIALMSADLSHHLLPSRILYPTLLAVSGLLVAASFTPGGRGVDQLGPAAGLGLGSFACFFVIYLAGPAGMGFADIRLAGLAGLCCGWRGAFTVFGALILGVAAAGVAILALMATEKLTGDGAEEPRRALPFGPFIALGALVALVAGSA